MFVGCLCIVNLSFQQEELSEQLVRIGLQEKKLENACKDSDDKVEKVQQKLDDLTVTMKKKEKYEQGWEAYGIIVQFYRLL